MTFDKSTELVTMTESEYNKWVEHWLNEGKVRACDAALLNINASGEEIPLIVTNTLNEIRRNSAANLS